MRRGYPCPPQPGRAARPAPPSPSDPPFRKRRHACRTMTEVSQPTPPRRILMVIHNLRPGGAERQTEDLARGLARRGYDVTLACIDEPDVDTGPLSDAGVE